MTVVVVSPGIERLGGEGLVADGGVQQVGRVVTGVPTILAGALVGRTSGNRTERVHHLVYGDGCGRDTGASLVVDDGKPESRCFAPTLAAHVAVGDRAVVVDEVLGERRAEPRSSQPSKTAVNRPLSDSSWEPDCGRRTVVMSSWAPHGNWVRSFRGTRVVSCVRHQASISSPSVCMTLPMVDRRSCPSEGTAYTQCTGLPAIAFGARSICDAAPHHVDAARAELPGNANPPTLARVDVLSVRPSPLSSPS